MQVSLVSKQFDLGESLTAYINDNIQKVVTKYFEKAISANITFTKEGDLFTTDISVHPAANITIQATDSNPDAYTAFDEAINKISAQLAKQKDKLTDYTNDNNDSFKS